MRDRGCLVALLPLDIAPKPAKTLNPLFELNGVQYSMVTQYMAAIPVKVLKDKLFNVTDRRTEIVAARRFPFTAAAGATQCVLPSAMEAIRSIPVAAREKRAAYMLEKRTFQISRYI